MNLAQLQEKNAYAVKNSEGTSYVGLTVALGTIALAIFMVAVALKDLVAAYLNKRED